MAIKNTDPRQLAYEVAHRTKVGDTYRMPASVRNDLKGNMFADGIDIFEDCLPGYRAGFWDRRVDLTDDSVLYQNLGHSR